MKKKVFIAALFLVVTGCATFGLLNRHYTKPEITFEAAKITEITQRHAVIQLTFIAHNPNTVGFRNIMASYQAFVEEKRIVQGKDVPITLAPKSDTTIEVPAEVMYSDLIPALGNIAERLIKGEKSAPLVLRVEFTGRPVVIDEAGKEKEVSFEMHIVRSVEVALPFDTFLRGMNRFRDTIRKLE